MICPYSLSIPGGVQGQVLGLARALRELGLDARVLAPVRRPAPDAVRHVGRAEHQGGEQRIDLTDRAGQGRRAAHARGPAESSPPT